MRAQADSGTDLRAVVSRGRALLGRAVRAAWEQRLLTRDPDGLFSGMLGAPEIEKLIERAEADTPATPVAAAPTARCERLATLAATIDGGAVAEDVLGVALALELDAVARTLAGYLRGGAAGGALTTGALVLALGEERTGELLIALGVGAPLRRHRLIEVTDKNGELGAAAMLRAAPRLVRWLVDPAGLDDEVAAFARLERPRAEPIVGEAALATVEAAVVQVSAFLQRGATADLVLRGPRGVGRGEIAREACRRLGLPLLTVGVGELLAQANAAEAGAAVLREALLLGAQVLFEDGDRLLAADSEDAAKVRAQLAASPRPLLVTAGPSAGRESRLGVGRALVMRDVPMPATNAREEIWRERLPEVPAGALASLYRIGLGAIQRVSQGARLGAEVRGAARVEAIDVAHAVRAEFETDLGQVATRVDVSQSWEDLVVPEDTGRTIAELVDQLRHRSTVLGRWGLGRKLGRGLGTTALFAGEPGTGKSMVAGLIAKELGLELYQIDLSRVLSKWIGETEKNLGRVFDAAETGHVVLLFDEADALLGKRTVDVKSSNDRYANLETNYILQRLEAFHGVAILTSNLESSIDPALSRRLSFELRFPFPDVEQRAEIWRRMLPAELPVEGELDFQLLATRFELAGGHIRNLVLRAAYLAASDGGALTMAHLLRAAEYEYRDHGMLVAKGRLAK